jgi:hypothetical protein
MKVCPICFKPFHKYGYKMHLKYCIEKLEYYKNPKKCLNPECSNIIPYTLWHRNKQKFCCRSCTYTKERRKFISEQNKRLFQENPDIFKNFGVRNSVHIKYKTKDGNNIILQSSYEERVAIELDKNNVLWNRPSYLRYIDVQGKYRRYFPDFYLLDYDVYLDPKNDYLIQTDSDKIRRCRKQNNIKIFILTERQLYWKTIQKIILTDRL